MAFVRGSPCRKANRLTVYENQGFIAKNSTAETLLSGSSIVNGLIDMKELGRSISPTVLISASAEIAQKMLFGELLTCQECII